MTTPQGYLAARDRLLECDLLDIVEDVCRKYHVTLRDVISKARHKSISAARRECWFLLYSPPGHPELGMSYPQIGALFARNDTTVRDAILPLLAAERAKSGVAKAAPSSRRGRRAA